MENPVVQNKKGGDAVASAEDDVGVNALLRENYKEDEDVPAAQALTLLVTGWSRYDEHIFVCYTWRAIKWPHFDLRHINIDNVSSKKVWTGPTHDVSF